MLLSLFAVYVLNVDSLKNSNLFLDETRQISQCICGVIDSIDGDLNEDYEERLKFYTDCRGQFKRLEYVQWRLTHKSLSLATSILIRSNQRQNSSNRVRGFFQVCSCQDVFFRI